MDTSHAGITYGYVVVSGRADRYEASDLPRLDRQFIEYAEQGSARRPVLVELCAQMQAGDCLVVGTVYDLGESARDVLEVLNLLKIRGVEVSDWSTGVTIEVDHQSMGTRWLLEGVKGAARAEKKSGFTMAELSYARRMVAARIPRRWIARELRVSEQTLRARLKKIDEKLGEVPVYTR